MKLLTFALLFLVTTLARAEDYQQFLEKLKDKVGVPGVAGLLYRNGKVLEMAAAGVKKAGDPARLQITDKFHLGSCSKAMTATVVATLVEEGKLHWKDTLASLLPKIKIHPDFQQVTLEMVLAHQSGLIKDIDDKLEAQLETTSGVSGRKIIANKFLGEKASFPSGKYNYSNNGYIIVGHILEEVTGRSFEMLVNERLFAPLHMTSCGFGPTSNPTETMVLSNWGHRLLDGKLIATHDDNVTAYAPAANIHCSMEDWLKFLRVHLDGENGIKSLLSLESIKQLHRPSTSELESYTYGGWQLINRSWAAGLALQHGGTNTYNFANVWIAPKKNLIELTVANLGGNRGWEAVNGALAYFLPLDK